jgi:uncharacterized membrane protein YphA (DoxX/SURF4 family)
MTGDERIANIEMLIRNISIIGGLLMLMVIGPWRPTLDEDEQGVYAR